MTRLTCANEKRVNMVRLGCLRRLTDILLTHVNTVDRARRRQDDKHARERKLRPYREAMDAPAPRGPVKARISSTAASCSSWPAAPAWGGVGAEMAKFGAGVSASGLVADIGCLPRGDDFRGQQSRTAMSITTTAVA
jgi:hypothetical protein